MNTSTITNANIRLGDELHELLLNGIEFNRIVFVSAFTALRTVLRFRELLATAADNGADIHLVLGIDLHGTSKEVLEEVVGWNCDVRIFHNSNPRATFHPKIYLFENDDAASLVIGSNNLTDGGMYTNFEAATRHDFCFPEDCYDYDRIITPLKEIIFPNENMAKPLTNDLIDILVARGMVTSEMQARQRFINQGSNNINDLPDNPFQHAQVQLAPLLHQDNRSDDVNTAPQLEVHNRVKTIPDGTLVWKKELPNTDALQVRPGSHHVGGVRLTQARFIGANGGRIDQTTYFRQLFSNFDWNREPGRRGDQEHAFVPMRLIIREEDFGIKNFEISHKPSGEAGQANYTTILRWGAGLNDEIIRLNIAHCSLYLYETDDPEQPFLIIIK